MPDKADDKIPKAYLKTTFPLIFSANFAKKSNERMYNIEINPKTGPAIKDTSKIARKLKSSNETVIIFASPQMVLDIP